LNDETICWGLFRTGKESAADLPEKFVLYQDLDGTTYDVDLPLTSNVNAKELREDLGLPSYIDLDYFPMRSAMVTLWASVNAPKLHELYPHAFEKRASKGPIPALLFGGAAVKILCKSANSGGSLARVIKDTDFIVPKKQGMDFYKLLLNVHKAFGTQYKSFATSNDRRFNMWRSGERYRLTTINGITEEGFPKITVLDLLCDWIDLRHKVEVKDVFDKYKENLHTIGLEYLLLSKAQFILDMPKERMEELRQCECDYRILSYPYYAEEKIIVGMEDKDVKDVCAVFLDHEIGKEAENIDSQKMGKILEKDKKLALTVTLNLKNLVEKSDVLRKWISKNEVSTVTDRIEALLKELPLVDKKWDKPWWNTAVETPTIE
jgi:predicted nucleic acid-binding protein